MKYNELVTPKLKAGNRVGRGISAGQGKTAGRGTKGQNARTGSTRKPGFEGGQNPLMQRLPKLRGFRSFRIAEETVYTGQLALATGKVVDSTALAEAGLLSSAYVRVKLLNNGEVNKAFTVKLPSASQSAIAAVEAAGGSYESVAQLGRPVTRKPRVSKKDK
jgi:large subunit ribosomal protein L15